MSKVLALIVIRNYIKKEISERKIKPNLVGFLANDDPAAHKYAEQTAKSFKDTGFGFNLIKVDKHQLETSIMKANMDKNVNGIMVYYPVFGDHMDNKLQNTVDHLKDIEGLGHISEKKTNHNKRGTIPCTPLAIMKVNQKK